MPHLVKKLNSYRAYYGYKKMNDFSDYKVADISLAEWGAAK